MDDKTKERLKAIPRAKCFKCNSMRAYTNPIEKCFECKQKFCFQHLFGGQVNSSMGKNDEIRNVCGGCRKKFKYRTL